MNLDNHFAKDRLVNKGMTGSVQRSGIELKEALVGRCQIVGKITTFNGALRRSKISFGQRKAIALAGADGYMNSIFSNQSQQFARLLQGQRVTNKPHKRTAIS